MTKQLDPWDPGISKEELDRKYKQDDDLWSAFIKNNNEKLKAFQKIDELLTKLQIPHDSLNLVRGIDLVDILMNEEKVKAILTLIRCKAFW